MVFRKFSDNSQLRRNRGTVYVLPSNPADGYYGEAVEPFGNRDVRADGLVGVLAAEDVRTDICQESAMESEEGFFPLVVSSSPSARATASVVFSVGFPRSLKER